MVSPAEPAGVRTLVVRLAGPLQSWGESSPYTVRGTLPYPTYSGLLGLARAALGSPRSADLADWEWLRGLTMAVRIDEPGQIIRDFHTVNPPPSNAWTSRVGQGRKSSKASGVPHTVPVGSGQAWSVGKTPSTLITERYYITDATFIWLIEGPEVHVRRLAAALNRPVWQLSLGRKACLPEWPLVLGTSGASLIDVAESLPVRGLVDDASQLDPSQERERGISRNVDLHMIQGAVQRLPGFAVSCTDDPVGSHPHDGHVPRVRSIVRISAPTATRPGLTEWSLVNLELP